MLRESGKGDKRLGGVVVRVFEYARYCPGLVEITDFFIAGQDSFKVGGSEIVVPN